MFVVLLGCLQHSIDFSCDCQKDIGQWCCAAAVSFDATLSDFYTSSFQPGTKVYNSYIVAVATAANVSSAYVRITSIHAGSVLVSTEVITKSTEASDFRWQCVFLQAHLGRSQLPVSK